MHDGYDRIKDTLRLAYDRDVARRQAVQPSAWRIDLADQFAAHARRRGLHRVLELGAGTGQLAAHLQGHGLDVVATDLSPASVAAMRERGLTAEVVDLSALPYPDAAFDAAFAMNALLHVPKDRLHGVMRGVRRVVRAGGLAMIVVWGGPDLDGPIANDWLDPPRFFSLYSDDAFHALAFPGFATVRSDVLDVTSGPDGELHPQVKLLEAV